MTNLQQHLRHTADQDATCQPMSNTGGTDRPHQPHMDSSDRTLQPLTDNSDRPAQLKQIVHTDHLSLTLRSQTDQSSLIQMGQTDQFSLAETGQTHQLDFTLTQRSEEQVRQHASLSKYTVKQSHQLGLPCLCNSPTATLLLLWVTRAVTMLKNWCCTPDFQSLRLA